MIRTALMGGPYDGEPVTVAAFRDYLMPDPRERVPDLNLYANDAPNEPVLYLARRVRLRCRYTVLEFPVLVWSGYTPSDDEAVRFVCECVALIDRTEVPREHESLVANRSRLTW